MAFSITSGRIPGAKKIVIYGPEGIGKSTLASQFPDPVFIDTEDSTKDQGQSDTLQDAGPRHSGLGGADGD